jgi:hypothetical protein
MRNWIAGSLVGSILCCSAPALGQSAEILSGSATVLRAGKIYPVGRGVRLYERDRLIVSSPIQIIGDFGAYIATQKKGILDFTLMRRDKSGCIQNFISYLGQLQITPRPLTCRRSIIQVLSLASGGSYTFRGTDATLTDNGNRSTLMVTNGSVETQSVGQTVTVDSGFGNVIVEGLPPGEPIPIDNNLGLRSLRVQRFPWGIKLSGTINPLNLVQVEEVEVVNKNGFFQTMLRFPIPGNDLAITISNLAGQSRVYIFPLPTRK